MIKNINCLVFSGIFLLLSVSSEAQQDDSLRVLFIGNSYTYFWNLPQMVQAMAKSRDIKLSTRQSTAGGVHLGVHWRGERGLNTVEMIENGDYDIVVLQDHSLRAIQAADSLLYYGLLLDSLIDQNQGETMLYMTWSREYNPLMQEKIAEQYERLGEQTDGIVVAVGQVWDEARRLRPDLGLYDADGSHPSPLGTYLTACVFFQMITGESPIGLPHRLISEDLHGEKLYLAINSSGDAEFCQHLTHRLLQQKNAAKD